ncbi:hypothetical protein VTO42DRAFT_6999 [Malbranchea cinnamomea]
MAKQLEYPCQRCVRRRFSHESLGHSCLERSALKDICSYCSEQKHDCIPLDSSLFEVVDNLEDSFEVYRNSWTTDTAWARVALSAIEGYLKQYNSSVMKLGQERANCSKGGSSSTSPLKTRLQKRKAAGSSSALPKPEESVEELPTLLSTSPRKKARFTCIFA